MTKTVRKTMVLLGALALAVTSLSAQGRRGQQPPPGSAPDAAGVSPAEVQRLFDSAALIQAQQRLNIRDDQFPQFLRRFKSLQDIRRQSLTVRMRTVQQLQRLLAAATLDETAVNDRLKVLRDLDAQQAADVSKAYRAIDEVLDVRQRAQFRIFEETMERQKLNLVTRARQANRARPQF